MIRVEYGVITKGAKGGFVPELLNCAPVSNADDLNKDDLVFRNYTNPCEKYSALLDNSSLPIPENTENENMGIWSLYAANANGEFEDVFPTVILVADRLFSVDGLGLTFDTINNIYPTNLVISWYNNDALIFSKEYQSVSTSFLLTEDIENFNKIVIVFKKMNTPYSRMKLHSIQYGTILIIEENSIKNMKLHQAVSPISSTLPIGAFDLSFINTKNANYNFETRESLKVFDGDVLVGKYFIENAKQSNKQQWSIKAQDYINILENVEFEGGIYFDELALNILTLIFNKANVPFTISDEFKNTTLTGYIPHKTCRSALQQVLFAIGGYADTSYSEDVKILKANMMIAESIDLDRVFTQTISVDANITELKLFAHIYTPVDDEIVLYEAEETDEAEENVKMIFNEPIHNLAIENGEIIESGTNYAIINTTPTTVLKGKKYDHTTYSKSKYHTAKKHNQSDNIKVISNATLISPNNIDNILDLCYNYIARNKSIKSRIVEGENPLVVGKFYEIETELLSKTTGFLTEQNFLLYGGKKVVKETVIK